MATQTRQKHLKDMTPEEIAEAVQRTPSSVIQQRAYDLLYAPDLHGRIAAMWDEIESDMSRRARFERWLRQWSRKLGFSS